eukprot:TRINITY_DN60431_c0_g1_i1.p1 TRINITY_DN60431_c0_g1~~TRINITY_DN60431_c0_g1_i1.p1  ORF type:complete len:1976 (+),score=519.89 TRINITY_DN60431_c0_g1_i1:75-6002(+)
MGQPVHRQAWPLVLAAGCAASELRLPYDAVLRMPRSGLSAVAYPRESDEPRYLEWRNLEKWLLWRDGLPDPPRRGAASLEHWDYGPPAREGNHAPTFTISGDPIKVREDSGPYDLGAQYAKNIDDQNGHKQTVHFECTNDNPELFEKQPDIISCTMNFCTGTRNVLPGTGTLIFTPRADRFGTARVSCRARDSGIEIPVCNNNLDNTSPSPLSVYYAPGFPCTPVPCDTPGSSCNESPQQDFVIEVTPINDCPEFAHIGDIVSPEDVEQCIENWAYQVTAGGWEEDYKQMSSQMLFWSVKNDNPSLFKTQPYIKYTQGSYTGDLCFTPATDATGKATVEIYLTDDGGTADSGCDAKRAETISITIIETNDPPTFTPGRLRVVVEEDSGAHDIPWATQLSPGPQAEVTSRQELDRFVIDFINPAHKALFKVPPVLSIETGHLTFEVADDANTFGIDCAMTVHLVDTATPPSVPATSPKPWPVLHIEITPVNDPPSYVPPQPDKDVTVVEGQAVNGWQWARDVCIGKAPPNCVESEGFSGGENQKIVFVLQATNQDLFTRSPTMGPDGKLSFTAADNKHGTSVVTVYQTDTGPPPNEGPTHNFAIVVLPVNDPPAFDTMKTRIEVLEDSGPQVISRFLERVTPGPPDEWSQRMSFDGTVVPADVYKTLPYVDFQSQGTGPTFGHLRFEGAPDRFGVTNLTFAIREDGGTENAVRWPAKVQKDSTGSLGMTLQGDLLDVTWVDPDGTAWAAGIRQGMRLYEVQGRRVTTLAQGQEALRAAPDSGEFSITVQNGTDVRFGPLVQIHVVNVNDPPYFLKGPDVAVLEDHLPSRSIYARWAHDVTAGPFEDGVQEVSFNCTHTPAWGLDPPGVIVDKAGTMNFSLARDFYGQVTVAVRITDHAHGNRTPLSPWSEPQTFTITATPVNDPPQFELLRAPLEIPICPTFDANPTAFCEHHIKNFTWDVSPGPPNEGAQRVVFRLIPSIPISEWAALFVPHHLPEVSPEDGTLHFELRRGVAPRTPEFPVQVVLVDDGGTADGGIDSNRASVTVRFVPPGVATSTDRVPSALVIERRTVVQAGSPVVTPPVFRSVDASGAAVALPNGSTFQLRMIPVAPSVGEPRLWSSAGAGQSTFASTGVSIYEAGNYRFEAEAHLPDGHILRAVGEPFVLGSAGAIDAAAYRDNGATVISERALNEWDLRGDDMRLVLFVRGNSWRPAALRATVELHRRSASLGGRRARTRQADGSVTTTDTRGSSAVVNRSQGLDDVTVLESTNTIDGQGHLTLQLLRYPALNLLEDAALVVRLPAGSVGGEFAPPPVEFRLVPAPPLRVVGGNMSEEQLRSAGDGVILRLLGNNTWAELRGATASARFGYAVAALSAYSTQEAGFNALRERLVTVSRMSARELRLTLGPLADYDIREDEVVRIDPAQLRVTGGIPPDFDGTPSTFTIYAHTAKAVIASPAPPLNEGRLSAAADALGVIVAVSAIAGALGTTPLMICGPHAAAYVALCGAGSAEGAEPRALWRGLRWWAAPEALRLGGGDEAAQYAQGVVVVAPLVLGAVALLHLALAAAHRHFRPRDAAGADGEWPLTRSMAAVRFPSLLLYLAFPVQQLLLFAAVGLVFAGSDAAAGWKVAAVLAAGLFTAAAFACAALPVAMWGELAAYQSTAHWPQHGLLRVALPKGTWSSHSAAAAAADGNLRLQGVQRFGSMFAAVRPSRLWLQPCELLWLCALNAAAARCSRRSPGEPRTAEAAVSAVLCVAVAVGFAVYRPYCSPAVSWVRVLVLALLALGAVLIAAGLLAGSSSTTLDLGAVLLLVSLVVACLLFLLCLGVLIAGARYLSRYGAAAPPRGTELGEADSPRRLSSCGSARRLSSPRKSGTVGESVNPISVVFAPPAKPGASTALGASTVLSGSPRSRQPTELPPRPAAAASAAPSSTGRLSVYSPQEAGPPRAGRSGSAPAGVALETASSRHSAAALAEGYS